MRLEDLKYMLEIERCGSINKAAQNLFLSHSTLSYIVQGVEQELGYPIFFRSKRGAIPTPRGAEILKECHIIMNLIARWHDPAHSAQEIKGHVQITSIPIFSRILGLDMLIRLKQNYPNLTIHFEERKLFLLEDLLTQMSKSTARILVGSLSGPERAVFEHKFSGDPDWSFQWADVDSMALHISARHPLARREILYPEDLSELPLLFYPDSGGRFGYSGILRYFPSIQTYNISTSELVLDMVAENLSVTLASRLVTARSGPVRSGAVRCVPVDGFPMPMNYYVLYPSEPHITAAEGAVIEGIQKCFRSMEEMLQ
ncbi:MAG: LysR family transcriptional regulator [Oscillospiraceae bacterium]|nr:LysR family transcriptional regulator [Oscillospiraceae bacterium]